MANIYIGTSGWNYTHWADGVFYPPKLKQSEWLSYYSKWFNTVEINTSFYHLPPKKDFENWKNSVYPGFIFSVKVNRFITHRKKLKDPESTLPQFIESVKGLADNLGPLLFQLPPFWKVNNKRLEMLLRYMRSQQWGKSLRIVFEFRNDSWFNEETFLLLKEYRASICLADWPGLEIPCKLTTEFFYIRRHGPQGLYSSCYSDEQLRKDAKLICELIDKGIEVYVYFNNDAQGWAVKNGLTIKRFCSQKLKERGNGA